MRDHNQAYDHNPPRPASAALIAVVLTILCTAPVWSEPPAKKYSDDVVTKADAILDGVGLRRSGKTIASTQTADLSRALTSLTKDRRELKLVHQAWKQVHDSIDSIRDELEQRNIQDGQLSLRLAAVAGDVTANNQTVGLINANRAAMRALVSQRDKLKDELSEKRAALNKAESDYAAKVLAIRRDYRTLQATAQAALETEPVKIALRVMAANFETPLELGAETILASLDKRIKKIEQEIFSESIPLEVVGGGSLYVSVAVGNKTTRMVVDSGATLVSLPASTAKELGIVVPVDAPEMSLVMADGRTIPARAVRLDRVRVGEFEATGVTAAVLDESAAGAEPLLGMSYLGNFKFEIDTSQKTLKMLRVDAE